MNPPFTQFNFTKGSTVSPSGVAVLPHPHHPQRTLHLQQLPRHLLQGGAQRLRDGGLLQRPVPAACPPLPGPAAATRHTPRGAVLPAGQRPEQEVRAGVHVHAQGLLLRSLPGIPGQSSPEDGVTRISCLT